jgi:hypothetical protein
VIGIPTMRCFIPPIGTAVWELAAGTTYQNGHYGPGLPLGWEVVDCPDFDEDGQSDYLLFNSRTSPAIWFLSDGRYSHGSYGPTLRHGWKLIAAANFNPEIDHHLDYLLFNPSTGRTAIWDLNGTKYTASTYGPTVPAGWSLIGCADFFTDNHQDYIFFNAGSRKTGVWFLEGSNFIGWSFGPTLPQGWVIARLRGH